MEINQTYLSHNTLTDIVTFNQSEEEGLIEGDIYISVDRIKENANKFDKLFEEELFRVIIHGVLHLLGYKDKSPKETKVMREKEDHYIQLFHVEHLPK